MTDQSQKAGKGAIAVQSGGDTTINQGIGPREMSQILEALASHLQTYAAVARDLVDVRLTEFKTQIIEQFQNHEKANPEAFKDPDFQYLLTRSQHAYARSGDAIIRDTLIDLIARRSKEPQRSRMSLTLNDAVEKSAYLTKNEFAELSLAYLLRYTASGTGTMAAFKEHIERIVGPLLPDISRELASYQYLEAQSCGIVEMGEIPLERLLIGNYGGLFSDGFERTTLEEHLSSEKADALEKLSLIVPCLNAPNKLQFKALNQTIFNKRASNSGLSAGELTNAWGVFENTMWSSNDVVEKLSAHVPIIKQIRSVWNETPLKSLKLTTVGIAIGHANLARIANFNPDLSQWIR